MTALPPTPLHVGGGRVLTGDSAAHPPGLEHADVGERMRTADVVPLKSAPKEADEQGSSAMPRPSRRPARHATRRRSLPRAAAIPAEGDRYVSLAEAGELYSVSQEPSADASAKEPSPPSRVATTSSVSCSVTWQSCSRRCQPLTRTTT